MKIVLHAAHSETFSDLSKKAHKDCNLKRRGGGGVLSVSSVGAALGLSGWTDAQNATDVHVQVFKVLVNKVIPNSKLTNSWDSKEFLSRNYAKDLEKLPHTSSPDTKAKFHSFFKKWGQGFVATGYYGGEARIEVKSDLQGTRERFSRAGSVGATSIEHNDSSDLSYQGSTLSLTSLPPTRMQYSFTANSSSTESLLSRNMVIRADFRGGNPGNHWKRIS